MILKELLIYSYPECFINKKLKLFSARKHFCFIYKYISESVTISSQKYIYWSTLTKTFLISKIRNITLTIFTPHIIYLSNFNIFLFFIPIKTGRTHKKIIYSYTRVPQPFKRPIECRPARFGAVCSPIQVIDSSESLEQRLSIIVASNPGLLADSDCGFCLINCGHSPRADWHIKYRETPDRGLWTYVPCLFVGRKFFFLWTWTTEMHINEVN